MAYKLVQNSIQLVPQELSNGAVYRTSQSHGQAGLYIGSKVDGMLLWALVESLNVC